MPHAVPLVAGFAALVATALGPANEVNGADVRNGAVPVAVDEAMLFSLDFAPDGSLLAAGGYDSIWVFETRSGKLLQRWKPPKRTFTVAFSPNRKGLLAAAGDEGAVGLWRIGKDEPVRVLKGHTMDVRDLAFSPDGALLATVGLRLGDEEGPFGELRIWNTATGALRHSEDFSDARIWCIAFSNDGKRLAVSKGPVAKGDRTSIELYDLKTWKTLRSIRLSQHTALAYAVRFTPDGNRLLIAGLERESRPENPPPPHGALWSVDLTRSGAVDRLQTAPPHRFFRSIGIMPRGHFFATSIDAVRKLRSAAGEPVGWQLVVEVQLRNASRGVVIWSRDAGNGTSAEVAVSRDGTHVAACGNGGNTIYVFHADTGRKERVLTVHK